MLLLSASALARSYRALLAKPPKLTQVASGPRYREVRRGGQQVRQLCDKVNSTYKKHLHAVPRELFAVERLHLRTFQRSTAWRPRATM